MKDNIIMVIAELEDGREHISSKQNKPLKYDLSDKRDLEILEEYQRRWVDEKSMCYSKDLTRMWRVDPTNEHERVMVKSLRYEPYVESLHIPYRTFSVMYDPKKGEPNSRQIERAENAIKDHVKKTTIEHKGN